MIQDARYQLSTAQAITSSTAFSTNSADIGTIVREVGNNEPLAVVFRVTTTFAINANTPLLTFQIVLDASDSAPGTLFTVIGASGLYAVSNGVLANDLTAGTLIPVVINPLSDAQRRFMKTVADLGAPLRYLWARYELAAGTFSAGAVSAALTGDTASRVPIELYADRIP